MTHERTPMPASTTQPQPASPAGAGAPRPIQVRSTFLRLPRRTAAAVA